MSKRVVIETEECIGCQSCVELCPDIFGFDEDAEKAKVILEEGWAEDCIQDAGYNFCSRSHSAFCISCKGDTGVFFEKININTNCS